MYYANNQTEEFSDVCPSLITLDIVSRDNVIMINGSVAVNITQSGLLNLYIGRLPGEDVMDVVNFSVGTDVLQNQMHLCYWVYAEVRE